MDANPSTLTPIIAELLSKPGLSTLHYIVIRLLMHAATQEGKRVEFTPDDDTTDAVAPDGIADQEGPTGIYVVRTSATGNRHELARAIGRARYWAAHKSFLKSALVVFPTLSKRRAAQLSGLFHNEPGDFPVAIFGPDQLEEIARNAPRLVDDLKRRGSWWAATDSLAQSRDKVDWKKQREERIGRLRSAYTANDLVLVLGAGVSQTAGMPTWTSLLSRFLVAVIGEALEGRLPTTVEQRNAIAGRLRELQPDSPLIEARYVRTALGDNFESTLRALLYTTGVKSDSPLPSALARLCIPKRSGPGVKSVITYNFDDVIERYFDAAGVEYRSIFRDDGPAATDELAVYHVHGFVPEDPTASSETELNEYLVVFSEERYHKLFLEPYVASNLVQVNAYRDSTCLFVGMSMTDPNLRRLLDIAAASSARPRHFVFAKRVTEVDLALGDGVQDYVVSGFLAAHHELQEKAFGELGLNVLWVDDYEEEPVIVDSLRRSDVR